MSEADNTNEDEFYKEWESLLDEGLSSTYDLSNYFASNNTNHNLGMYYLFVPFIGPMVDPDNIKLIQVEKAKTWKGKVIRSVLWCVEKVDEFLEANIN